MKLIMEWDENKEVENEIQCRIEQQQEDIEEGQLDEDEILDEEEITKRVYISDTLTWRWEDFIEYLSDTLKEYDRFKSEAWRVKVNGFGWRNLSGHKTFKALKAEDFLGNILPDCNCSFKIFKDGKRLKIQNFHHDSPTGNEWYTIENAKECERCYEVLENNKQRYCEYCKNN